MKQATLALALLLGLTATVRAEDAPSSPPAAPPVPAAPSPSKPAPPPTPEQAADAVLAAIAANDDATLKALASKDAPDPWLVADELIRREQHDAAEAFAKAAPRVDVERLPVYVASRRGQPDEPARRERLARANGALAARDHAAALAALGDPEAGPIDDVVGVRLAFGRGLSLANRGQPQPARETLVAAGEAAERLGWLARATAAFSGAADVVRAGGGLAAARELMRRVLAVAERRGRGPVVAATLADLGTVTYELGDRPGALEWWARSTAVHETTDDPVDFARVLANVAVVQRELGDRAAEIAALERCVALREKTGDHAGLAIAFDQLGAARFFTGDPGKALRAYERAAELREALGDRLALANALNNVGSVLRELGDVERSLTTQRRALELFRALGDVGGGARAEGNIGILHATMGRWAEALTAFERALAAHQAQGDRAAAATVLGNIGGVYHDMGDIERAVPVLVRSTQLKEEVGDRWGAARTRAALGNARVALGDAEGIADLERSEREQRALGDLRVAAMTMVSVGSAQARTGSPERARETIQRALAELEALKERDGAASALAALGTVEAALGHRAEARNALDRAARAARSLRRGPLLVDALAALARVHLAEGAPGKALARAREGLDAVDRMLGGLADEEGAAAREAHEGLFSVGTVAAAREEDAGELVRFLEAGRAGALLDALAKRASAQWRAESLPAELREADARARAAERAARDAYDRAIAGGDRRVAAAAARVLDDASDEVRAVTARIQRESRKEGGLFYPQPRTLEEIRAAIEPGDALVVYALCLDEALALVVRHDGERVVRLGTRADVESACAALEARDPDADPAPALAALRRMLVEPLALEADVRRLVVSPSGPLAYVPFGALVDTPVALVPSGTTYVVLAGEERAPGDGVLALGDPDYAGATAGAGAVYVRGRPLVALPATRAEVERVGTTVLVGARASEAGLREALPTHPRWRAVHFACHGLVHPDKPTLCSLALSRGGDDDGFLTALEVLRTPVRADLVVLSACETGRGRIVRAEGILGLTSAFQSAGCPRVLCSLWKVDDAATSALMQKFYELWNPKTGSKGMGTAEALRAAQAHVRSQEKWKHPYYWAAWVLWGLPS
ncbi:MAG: CHAT domain-containing protein [Planctomycetes bacterium]|nr:CHAT domain-containing protein [Planctomycetota bacterium]